MLGNRIKGLLILIVISLYGCSSNRLAKQKYSISEIKDDIERLFQEELNFNGSILIAVDDQLIARENYGYIDFQKSKLIDNNSKYNIGSVCKEFTSIAILNLIEKGKLKFDTRISEILQELPEWSKLITIENLLFYESGLPNMRFRDSLNDNVVKEDLSQIESLLFKPGSDFHYSNLNNYLQAKIVEEITKENLSKYVEKKFFRPLKMRSAIYASNPPKEEINILKSYSKEYGDDIESNPNFKNFELSYAPVYLTIDDLKKWIKYIQTKYEDRRDKNMPIYRETTEMRIGPLGIIQKEDNLVIKHEHLGQAYNFETLMMRNYINKVTIILMTNNRKKDQLKEMKSKILKFIEMNILERENNKN